MQTLQQEALIQQANTTMGNLRTQTQHQGKNSGT